MENNVNIIFLIVSIFPKYRYANESIRTMSLLRARSSIISRKHIQTLVGKYFTDQFFSSVCIEMFDSPFVCKQMCNDLSVNLMGAHRSLYDEPRQALVLFFSFFFFRETSYFWLVITIIFIILNWCELVLFFVTIIIIVITLILNIL